MNFKTFFDIRIILAMTFLFIVSCIKAPTTPSPTPTPVQTPIVIWITPTPIVTPTPTVTPTMTPNPIPTIPPNCYPVAGGLYCPYPTPTVSPTPWPTPTMTPSPSPSGSPVIKTTFIGTFPALSEAFVGNTSINKTDFENGLRNGDLEAYFYRYEPYAIRKCSVQVNYGAGISLHYMLSCDPTNMDGTGQFVVVRKNTSVNTNNIIAWGNKNYFYTLFNNVDEFWNYGPYKTDIRILYNKYQ